MFASDKFQLVELLIPAGTTNNVDYQFQQQPQLQSFGLTGQKVYIEAIEVFSNTALSSSPYSSGTPIAAPADIINATLTLVEDSDKETRKDLPLSMLNRTWPSAPGFVPPQQQLYVLRNCFAVSWTKCFITVLTPSAIAYTYVLGVHYTYDPPRGTPDFYMQEAKMLQNAQLELQNAMDSVSGMRRY